MEIVFDDNSKLILTEQNKQITITLQALSQEGITSATVKLTEEETKQIIEWINGI